MRTQAEVAEWNLRLLGAALGAVCSLVVGALLFWTIVWLWVGIVGTPIGAMTGAIWAPRLARTPSLRGVVMAAAFASVVGVLVHLLAAAVAATVTGTWPRDVPELLFGTVYFFLYGFTIALPMAFGVGVIATWIGRGITTRTEVPWPASGAVVVAACLAALGGGAYVLGFAGL